MNNKTIVAALLAGFISSFSLPQLHAQTIDTNEVQGVLEKSIHKASQQGRETEEWQREKQLLLEELQDLELKDAWTSFQLQKTKRWIETETDNIKILEENLAQAERTKNSLEPFLEVVYKDLENHVLGDIPFSEEERSRRLSFVRMTFDDPHASLADKFGRLLDALQVEVEYGYTVEVSDEMAEINGVTHQVSQFRLGRLGLFRMYKGGSALQRYSMASSNWQDIDPAYIGEVRKAMEIARKKRVTTLVNLPIGEIDLFNTKGVN